MSTAAPQAAVAAPSFRAQVRPVGPCWQPPARTGHSAEAAGDAGAAPSPGANADDGVDVGVGEGSLGPALVDPRLPLPANVLADIATGLAEANTLWEAVVRHEPDGRRPDPPPRHRALRGLGDRLARRPGRAHARPRVVGRGRGRHRGRADRAGALGRRRVGAGRRAGTHAGPRLAGAGGRRPRRGQPRRRAGDQHPRVLAAADADDLLRPRDAAPAGDRPGRGRADRARRHAPSFLLHPANRA